MSRACRDTSQAAPEPSCSGKVWSYGPYLQTY